VDWDDFDLEDASTKIQVVKYLYSRMLSLTNKEERLQEGEGTEIFF